MIYEEIDFTPEYFSFCFHTISLSTRIAFGKQWTPFILTFLLTTYQMQAIV